jgi:hypothetical protein
MAASGGHKMSREHSGDIALILGEGHIRSMITEYTHLVLEFKLLFGGIRSFLHGQIVV